MSDGPWRNPTPTVDAVIRLQHGNEVGVVLIRRRNEPVGWALPGGFVDEGEQLEAACRREAAEETGLLVELEELLYVYSNPERDRRKHTISTVYTARADGEPVGQDDAAEAIVVPMSALRAMADSAVGPAGLPIVFDHALILRDALRFFDTGLRPRPVDGER